MSTLTILAIPVLSDNYAYVVHDEDSGATAVIDPSEAKPVLAALQQRGWTVTHVFNTHHHHDHVGGNMDLKRATGATIVGSRVDAERIPGLGTQVGDGDTYPVGPMRFTILHIPGHTRGHLALWLQDDHAVFTGDTLFTLGCGRVFEGTPEQMWTSLCRLRGLPESTRVYCGHEYTQKNAAFALTIEPRNAELLARFERTNALRADGKSTIPSLIGEERRTNPFLRCDEASVQQSVGLDGADPVTVFAEIRRRKDAF